MALGATPTTCCIFSRDSIKYFLTKEFYLIVILWCVMCGDSEPFSNVLSLFLSPATGGRTTLYAPFRRDET